MALIDDFRNQAQVRLAEGYSPDQLAQYAQNLGLTDAEINYALGLTGVRPGDADTNARIAAAVKQGQIQRGTYTPTATELTAAALAERTGDDPDRVLQQLQSGISAADYLANNETEQMNIAFAEGQRQAQINAENYLRDQASGAATTNTPVTTGPDLGSVDALIDPQQYVLPTDLAPFTPEDAASRYQQQLDVSQFTPSTYGVEPLMTQAQYDAGGVAASQGNTSGAAPINAISTTPIGYQATDPSSQSFTTRARQFRIVPAQTRMGGPQVVGAASTAPISFPNVPYKSALIKSLRDANKDPFINNPGVTLLANPKNSGLVLDFNKPVPKGLSNRPEKLSMKAVDPTAYVPPGDTGGDDGGRVVVDAGGGDDFIFSDYVIDDTDDTDDIDDSWSEWDDWDDPVVEEGTELDKVDEDPLDSLIDDLNNGQDPDPWDPENDGTDSDPWDPENDGADPDPWDPGNDDALNLDPFEGIPDDLGDDLIGATDDDEGTTGLGFTGDEGSATLDNPDNIVIEGDGVINFGDGGSDIWSEWDDWGDIGEDDLPVDDPFDDRDAFNSLYDFGFGFSGGGGGKSIDDVLIQMMQA